MSVDWSRQLEAVHVDGRVLAVDRRDTTKRNSGGWFVTLLGANWIVDDEGQVLRSGWRIRNVAQAPQTGSTAPSPIEVGPEVVERMIAFLRSLDGWDGSYALASDMTEARAIIALLPEPVDADLLDVRRIVADALTGQGTKDNILAGDFDNTPSIQAPLACLKRGRALAAGDRS